MTERVLEILFEHQHRGVEFDWLAADHAGHVGFFPQLALGQFRQRSLEAMRSRMLRVLSRAFQL